MRNSSAPAAKKKRTSFSRKTFVYGVGGGDSLRGQARWPLESSGPHLDRMVMMRLLCLIAASMLSAIFSPGGKSLSWRQSLKPCDSDSRNLETTRVTKSPSKWLRNSKHGNF